MEKKRAGPFGRGNITEAGRMMHRVDPGLIRELEAFGLKDAHKCYNCGNCTAVCSLSTPENPFPRKMVRYAQLGLKDTILHSPEPWLCYYCGDCSARCPRGAEPGETMMAMRRYLTSRYDWTGFSRRFYTSGRFETLAVVLVAMLAGAALLIFNTHSPDWRNASINSLWPAEKIGLADHIMALVLAILLLSNVLRCFLFIMGKPAFEIPARLYFSELKELVGQALTQKRFALCDDRKQWFVHLMIMTGYAAAFVLVVGFLGSFQRDAEIYPFWHPVRLLGYYATFAILYGTTCAIVGRLRKNKPHYRNSHGTDWVFLILLELTVLTGIFIHFARLLNWPAVTYTLYVIHMMAAVPLAVVQVPFAKWSHLAYRPVVLYLMKVKERHLREIAVPASAPAAEEIALQ